MLGLPAVRHIKFTIVYFLHTAQVADGLHFLHTQANQIHRGISPEAICITAAGAWKLAGFGFAMLADFGSTNPAEAAFNYADSTTSLAAQALKVYTHQHCCHPL